jgi:hypothetical protein
MKNKFIIWLLPCLFSFAAIKAQTIQKKEGIAHTNGIDIAYESFGPENRETILLIQGTGAQLTA